MTDPTIRQPGTPVLYPPGTRTPAELVEDARRADAEVLSAVKAGLEAALAAGKALAELRAKLAHGDWEDFVVRVCGIHPRRAARYLYLHKNKAKLLQSVAANQTRVSEISIARAVKLLTVAKPRRRRKPGPGG